VVIWSYASPKCPKIVPGSIKIKLSWTLSFALFGKGCEIPEAAILLAFREEPLFKITIFN